MKFRAHETFSIRKNWLRKGMKNIIDNPRIFVDKSINQMDVLGIGSNMVKSLRYWLQATGLTEEVGANQRHQELTTLGRLVWENDSYIEEDGTLCLLHYTLSTNKNFATSWYYFFNKYNMHDISKDSFIDAIELFIKAENGGDVARRSLEDDFECIIKTYLPNTNKMSPENNMNCPLSELELLFLVDKKNKIYSKKVSRKGMVNPLIILAVILNERDKMEHGNEIKISKLEKDECNIGRIFNLDNMAISYYLDKLQIMGYLNVVRTAGLDVIKITTDLKYADVIKLYYQELNN